MLINTSAGQNGERSGVLHAKREPLRPLYRPARRAASPEMIADRRRPMPFVIILLVLVDKFGYHAGRRSR